jgi:membrane protein DedA with SNARE-associated domain
MLCDHFVESKVSAQMLESLQSLFAHISPAMAYLLLTASAFTENVLPPVPGDTVVIIGAYLVSTGQLSFFGVYASTTAGSVIGFMTMFLISRRLGRQFIHGKKSRARIFKEENIKKVQVWFGNWGYWVILANRFLSGTRSVISIFAGLFHLNTLLVFLLCLLSACIWNGLLIAAGMLLGKNWEIIINVVSQYNKVLIVLTMIAIGIFFYRRYKKKKKTSGKPPVDLSASM